jgi:REP element-mobilizing transposase RayT
LEAALTNNTESGIQVPKNPEGKSCIMVVTPLPDLGELICESLKEYSKCQLFTTASKTITYLKQYEGIKQVILDMEMGEMRLLDLGRALRRINPTIEILIISKDEPSMDLDAIQPWKYLRKPLLLHDLLISLGIEPDEEVITSSVVDLGAGSSDERSQPLWITDPVMATRQLASMIERSSAQEALLIQNNSLWSYTGELSKASVQEVDQLISRSWDEKKQSDMLRFIKLETTQTEHALYATLLAMGVILALVFDSQVPFSIVRSQTNTFAGTLSLPASKSNPGLLSEGMVDTALLSNGKTLSWKQFSKSPYGPGQAEPVIHSSRDIFNAFVGAHISDRSDTGENKELREDASINLIQPDGVKANFKLEPVSDEWFNLTYSCLLISRFGSHQLTKDREKLISDCMKEIYTSYGWRIEYLEVKSDYLRWVASVPPTIALKDHMEIIRKETSRRLFDDFPPYKQENLSNDYWAPGYVILGGRDSLTDHVISEYKKQIRIKYGQWDD